MTPLPERTWRDDARDCRTIVLSGGTEPGDNVAQVEIRGRADGITVLLNPDQCDEIAADLTARAALIRSRGEVAR